MNGKVVAEPERFATEPALERLFARMDPCVSLKLDQLIIWIVL